MIESTTKISVAAGQSAVDRDAGDDDTAVGTLTCLRGRNESMALGSDDHVSHLCGHGYGVAGDPETWKIIGEAGKEAFRRRMLLLRYDVGQEGLKSCVS